MPTRIQETTEPFLVMSRANLPTPGAAYKGPATDMSKMTEEQGKAVMAQWNKWMKKVGPGLVDFGAPFGQGTSVVDDGSEKKAAKLTGYTIVEAKSLAGAKRLTKGHPFLSQGKGKFSIELFELVPM